MATDDEIGLVVKVGTFMLAAVGVLLVNNRFVLGKVSACNKEVNDKIVTESKEAGTKVEDHSQLVHQRITASERSHDVNCKADRQQMANDFKGEVMAMETRLKEHISLSIKANNHDT